MDARERIMDSHLKRNCCSETIMDMFLEDLGRDPEQSKDLYKAMGALCGGLHVGLACGALCAASIVLWLELDDPEKGRFEMMPEFTSWFKERFGGWNCLEITEGKEELMQTRCPDLMEQTYYKVSEMLEEF